MRGITVKKLVRPLYAGQLTIRLVLLLKGRLRFKVKGSVDQRDCNEQ